MTANTELMNEAKKSLQGNWGIAIGGMFVYIIVAAASGLIPLGSLILGGPLALGYIIFNKKIAAADDPKIENIFDGFKNFLPALAT